MATTSPPRATRLQFSLRLLLLAFTGFAIGFPIWYRWPYQVREEERDPLTGKVIRTDVITFQRQWGGDRIPHGPSVRVLGDTTITEHYVRGNPHGPYSIRDAKGQMSVSGQYVNGVKEGTWIESSGRTKVTANWHRHRLHGALEMAQNYRGQEKKTVATFEQGRLVSLNGKPVEDAAFGALDESKLDRRTAWELSKSTSLDCIEMPLQDCIQYLCDVHNIPILLDTTKPLDSDLPLTGFYSGIDLRSVLTLMTVPFGLACDDRYGCIWITTADDTKDWNDPTGVTQINPAQDSALGRVWNEPVVVNVVAEPLADLLARLAQPLNIEVDTTQIAGIEIGPARNPVARNRATPTVIYSILDLPFRHALGQLLYRTECRCEVRDDKLVILPPSK